MYLSWSHNGLPFYALSCERSNKQMNTKKNQQQMEFMLTKSTAYFLEFIKGI